MDKVNVLSFKEFEKIYESHQEILLLEKINFVEMLDELKKSSKKMAIATMIIGSLLTTFSQTQIEDILSRKEIDSTEQAFLMKALNKYKDVDKLFLSKDGFEHIKNEEKFKEHGYKIGDGKITIGYGHAEPVNRSKFKVGQKITRKTAEELLKKDIKVAEDGIQRIFQQWKKDKNHIKLTQRQFDAMVSMTFNMGISNFRQSDFIQHIKRKDFRGAAELIKTTGLRKNFSGLEVRREKEYGLFVSVN